MHQRFAQIGEYYAAGFFEETDSTRFERFSRGLRRWFEQCQLPQYKGEALYPCGAFKSSLCVRYQYSSVMEVSWGRLREKDALAAEKLQQELSLYTPLVPREHRVGGCMYTHCHINYHRLVREGLDSYEARVKKMGRQELRAGLLDVLAGIRAFHGRALDYLRDCGAENTELYHALEKVPFGPANTLYEALVAWNFVFYMDGCDNIGRPDADLIDFYRGEDMTQVLRRLFCNMDENNCWSGALGPEYNELTLQCLKACRGLRRPLLELRVTPDMPQEVWQAAVEAVQAGGGSPAFYHEAAYQSKLQALFPQIPSEDRLRFCGGGCTETMLEGLSNVGSLDAGVNVALIFERCMRESLPEAESFEAFYENFIKVCQSEILAVFDAVSASQKLRAEYRPQPMRTLFVDDCIDKERDFNDGGARYSWSIINLAGLVNVLDSLSVIRGLIFEQKAMDGRQLLAALDAGQSFLEHTGIARHGTDSEQVNALAERLVGDICAVFDTKTPWQGGRFLPASIQFMAYADAGKNVGATPDGRAAGAPLCDSVGAIHANDRLGPTALLRSAAYLCAPLVGTPVLNVSLNAARSIDYLPALVSGYFQGGGMQMQVTCVDQEMLQKAKEHPDQYPNLIVRVGGYSEYFARLSPALQQTVIDRMMHSV